jgi:prefoldin subunit 5
VEIEGLCKMQDVDDASSSPPPPEALAAGKFLLAASSSSHARTVAELKASVAVLCENDETNTPLLKECDDTCRKLSSSLTTMEHAVKDITSSLSAVSSMATELTSLLQERGDVEQQKWRAHEHSMQLKDEKISSEISACLRPDDMEKERARVDGRMNALRTDLEAEGAEKMHTLHDELSKEISKLILHITGIQQSFDAALGVVKSRVDNIKSEFTVQQEEMRLEKEDKGEVKKVRPRSTRSRTKRTGLLVESQDFETRCHHSLHDGARARSFRT